MLPKPSKLSLAVTAAHAEMSQPLKESALVASLSEYFGRLGDPREEELVEHKLLDMLVIAVCAVIRGADTWVEVETFGQARQAWLESFLDLPHGISPLMTPSDAFKTAPEAPLSPYTWGRNRAT